MTLVNSDAKRDEQRDGLGPDVTAYRVDEVPQNGKVDFSMMLHWAEVKKKETADPFVDPPEGKGKSVPDDFKFENQKEEAQLNRGQLCAYATALAGSQFLLHSFSVSICGNTARFIRWDRAGAIVTQSFNYIEKPELLAGFYWRFSRLSPIQQGFDPTVVQASPEEVNAATDIGLSLTEPSHREFRKISVAFSSDLANDAHAVAESDPR
jgi:Fungal protein kinase